MNIDDSSARSVRGVGVRRLARAALVAGAFSLGASAFGHTAIANAENEWDIEAYDTCMIFGQTSEVECCILSGGQPRPGGCVAPPARTLQSIQGVPLQPTLGQPGRAPMPPVGVIGAQAAVTNAR